MSISFSYLTTHCNLFSSLIMNVVMVAVVPEPASMYFEREGECEHARDCGGGDGLSLSLCQESVRQHEADTRNRVLEERLEEMRLRCQERLDDERLRSAYALSGKQPHLM